jgi:hypothetical protein
MGWLRVCAASVAVASMLAACGGGDKAPASTASPTATPTFTPTATQTPSAAEYERAISDWYAVYIPAAYEVTRLAQQALPSDPGEADVFLGEFLAKVHELKGVIAGMPSLQAPAQHAQFDAELRRAMGMKRDGAEMLFEAADSNDPRKWSTGITLLWDGSLAEIDAFCLLPESSSLRERYCPLALIGH